MHRRVTVADCVCLCVCLVRFPIQSQTGQEDLRITTGLQKIQLKCGIFIVNSIFAKLCAEYTSKILHSTAILAFMVVPLCMSLNAAWHPVPLTSVTCAGDVPAIN